MLQFKFKWEFSMGSWDSSVSTVSGYEVDDGLALGAGIAVQYLDMGWITGV
jgi:hypothetical protein